MSELLLDDDQNIDIDSDDELEKYYENPETIKRNYDETTPEDLQATLYILGGDGVTKW
ncbi:hypothetical protein J6590_009725 [Homalodisca vitripennis]|nr:hypothetical protein J6590_009725 [Homalodisca vitripennis]